MAEGSVPEPAYEFKILSAEQKHRHAMARIDRDLLLKVEVLVSFEPPQIDRLQLSLHDSLD